MAAIAIIVTATTTITATTPPTMAAVSDCAIMVVVLSDVVMGVVTEGLAAVLSNVVVMVHCGSPKELMTTEQLLSKSRRTPCTAMVESVWETKFSKCANSSEVLV